MSEKDDRESLKAVSDEYREEQEVYRMYAMLRCVWWGETSECEEPSLSCCDMNDY